MPLSISQTRATMKWRENNREHYNEIQNVYAKSYYLTNRDKVREYQKEYRERKRAEKQASLEKTPDDKI